MKSTCLSTQLYKPSDNYMNAVETDVLETKISQNEHTLKNWYCLRKKISCNLMEQEKKMMMSSASEISI